EASREVGRRAGVGRIDHWQSQPSAAGTDARRVSHRTTEVAGGDRCGGARTGYSGRRPGYSLRTTRQPQFLRASNRANRPGREGGLDVSDPLPDGRARISSDGSPITDSNEEVTVTDLCYPAPCSGAGRPGAAPAPSQAAPAQRGCCETVP